MKIGDLARATGVSPRLLRYYEEQGLIEARRAPSGHRRYGDAAVGEVARVRALLAAGLPTNVIRDLMACFTEGTDLDACAADHLRTHLAGVEARIAQLEATRSTLDALLTATSSRSPAAA
ncbi:MerR family transcriptional regulator [Yinghuangia sp. YIM S09857]|uniref:MerR family transcriptional regulator n=1 Tax=Yinghuangia sp. YIM S09857 TaxID=3436929 RepID=UPI003F536194